MNITTGVNIMQQKKEKRKELSKKALTRHLQNDSVPINSLGRMRLLEWLDAENHSIYWLAKTLGYSQNTIRKWITGEKIPTTLEASLAIEKLTDEYVTCQSWHISNAKVKKASKSSKGKKKN